MKTIMALIFKFATILFAAWIAFGVIVSNSFERILVVALAGIVLNYTLRNLVIFKSKGNIIVSIGYGILGAASAYIIDLFPINFTTSIFGLIAFAVIIMLIEFFFHIYLLKKNR